MTTQQQPDHDDQHRSRTGTDDDVRADILEDIRHLHRHLDDLPTTTDFRLNSTYSLPDVYQRWDSWADALRDAGLTDVTTSHTTERRGD